MPQQHWSVSQASLQLDIILTMATSTACTNASALRSSIPGIHESHHSRRPRAAHSPAANANARRRACVVRLCSTGEASSAEPTTSVSASRRSALSGLAAFCAIGATMRPMDAEATFVDERLAQDVFTASTQSVVSLSDYQVSGGDEKLEGVGSGFVWDKYGHIITNYHCVAKLVNDKTGTQAARVSIQRRGGTSMAYPATVIGFDRSQDLAVLKIQAPADVLDPIRIGTSSDLRVGQSVYAIGNPAGLSHTLTVGSVSGLSRSIPSATGDRIFGAIQTDAAISAGNSGGPLLDSFGRMVGVNTATFTRQGSGKSSGVNFAVPVDTVMKLVPSMIVRGEARA